MSRDCRRHDACYASHASTRRSTAVKRILTSGLVGTASAVAAILARSRWWVVLVVALAALRVFLIALRMTYRMIERLMELPCTCSFKGPWSLWNIELKVGSELPSPEPDPPKPKHPGRRKPPSTS